MLTITYSHALADPTYCDDGKTGGAELLKKLNVKANQPVPIKDIFQYITLSEAVWCLRVCKASQQDEARIATWNFVYVCLGIFPEVFDMDLERYVTARRNNKPFPDRIRDAMCMQYTENAQVFNDLYKIPKIITSDEHPSQVAVNLVKEVIRQGAIYYPDRDIETELRNHFERLIK